MKKGIWITVIAVAILMAGCSALKSAYQLTKCNYSYNSISGIKVAGIDFSNITAASVITAIPKITSLISGNFKELPLEMSVNVNVQNPSADQNAALSDLNYGINIDGLDIAKGNLGHGFTVQPGKTSVVPVVVKTDLCNILNSENRSTVLQIVKNFTGISSDKSTIKLLVSPVAVTKTGTKLSLGTVPVTFKYGGKK